jgi:ubiquinone/menaquinone biosynthesis C-methylase UbiE
METDLYLRVREKEGRLYSDEIVKQLPFVPSGHLLMDEWRARSTSASRLIQYLSPRPKPLRILEIGCGNGWLSNMLAASGHHVIGTDQNSYELHQAARVFSVNPKLLFIKGNIFSAPFSCLQFDVIVLASVIQYFQNVSTLLSLLLNYIKPQGEIHIIDSPFYSQDELISAMRRSQQYYSSLGFPEMSQHYFHHLISDLYAYHPKILYHPKPWKHFLNRWLSRVDSPFPWIVIKK